MKLLERGANARFVAQRRTGSSAALYSLPLEGASHLARVDPPPRREPAPYVRCLAAAVMSIHLRFCMEPDTRLVSPNFPRSSAYHPDWVMRNGMGGNPLWLTEWLAVALDLRPGMRVLDLGCGRAIS